MGTTAAPRALLRGVPPLSFASLLTAAHPDPPRSPSSLPCSFSSSSVSSEECPLRSACSRRLARRSPASAPVCSDRAVSRVLRSLPPTAVVAPCPPGACVMVSTVWAALWARRAPCFHGPHGPPGPPVLGLGSRWTSAGCLSQGQRSDCATSAPPGLGRESARRSVTRRDREEREPEGGTRPC